MGLPLWKDNFYDDEIGLPRLLSDALRLSFGLEGNLLGKEGNPWLDELEKELRFNGLYLAVGRRTSPSVLPRIYPVLLGVLGISTLLLFQVVSFVLRAEIDPLPPLV
jgi:hypothetical protein